jgi:hypothetical protein
MRCYKLKDICCCINFFMPPSVNVRSPMLTGSRNVVAADVASASSTHAEEDGDGDSSNDDDGTVGAGREGQHGGWRQGDRATQWVAGRQGRIHSHSSLVFNSKLGLGVAPSSIFISSNQICARRVWCAYTPIPTLHSHSTPPTWTYFISPGSHHCVAATRDFGFTLKKTYHQLIQFQMFHLSQSCVSMVSPISGSIVIKWI